MMPSARALISRIMRPLRKAAEGAVRSGPFHLPISGGWLPPGTPWNFWQLGRDPMGYSPSAVVERCVALYSETAASLPGAHWRQSARGGRERVINSALSRILRHPNDYQSSSDFMLNAVRSLYLEGNTFALALRNHRFEVESLHLMNPRMSGPMVAETGDIFFRLAGNAVVDRMFAGEQLVVPARDVLHIKLHSDRRYPWPLLGETPLLAAMMDVGLADAFTEQQIAFLKNQSRPSAVLSTDLVLDRSQVQEIKDRWNDAAKGLHTGGVPILTAGLKVIPWTTPARDAQLAELSKMSAERIAYAFRIPLQLLGLGGAPLGITEALMQFWLNTGLGFALNHVEQAFDQLFGLRGEPAEYTEFDTEALLRSNQKDRIEMLVRGVQGGIYSPNEARAAEGLDAVPYGDEPRLQQQVVPLSAAGSIPAAPAPPAPPSASAVDMPKMRSRRTEHIAGAAPPRVTRKTRVNGGQRCS